MLGLALGIAQGLSAGETGLSRIDQALEKARMQVDSLDLEAIAARVRDLAAGMELPENLHTKEAQQAAQQTAAACTTSGFQQQVQDWQALIAQGVEGKKTPQQGSQQAGPLSASEAVYLFLSSAMPEHTVQTYLGAIARAGDSRVLPVLSGFPSGLKNLRADAAYFSRLLHTDPACRDTPKTSCQRLAVPIRINSALFQHYNITRVPTLVYDNGEDSWAIAGDAELTYLLDAIDQEAKSPALRRLIARVRGGS